MSGSEKPVRILLGRIRRAHGIKGEVVVESYASPPEGIAGYGVLTDENGSRRLEFAAVRPGASALVARIKGIGDRTSAEKLAGTELWVEREKLPPAKDGEFYHLDLIGLAAVDEAGNSVGTIVGVQNFGAGDLLEIRRPGQRETDLLPFDNASVPEVDVAGGRVVVRFPSEA